MDLLSRPKLPKITEGKTVYDGNDGYVYSELINLKKMCAEQYATFSPNDHQLQNYKKHLERAYKLAEKHLNLTIVEINHEKGVYITKCPKYDGDLNDFFSESNKLKDSFDVKQIIDKIIDLLVYLRQNNIINDDIAFRNICYKITSSTIDTTIVNEISLYMIDFEQLRDYDGNIDDNYDNRENIELYLTYLLFDLEQLDKTEKIISYFFEKLAWD